MGRFVFGNHGATDTERLDWLGTHLAGTKWDDVLPEMRPRDADGEPTEKYITGPTMFRAVIDDQMRRGQP